MTQFYCDFFAGKELNKNERDQIRSFSGTRFLIIGKLPFLFIFKLDSARNMAMPIIPTTVNTRSKLLRSGLFEYLYTLLIVGVSSASQSMEWTIEEIVQVDPRMSLLGFLYENV